MMRKLLLFTLLFSAAHVLAQNQMTVSSTNTVDATGQNRLHAGQACFLGTLANGIPVAFNYPGGGTGIKRAVCASVVDGAYSIKLPNTLLTSPKNLCFKLTVKDTSNGTIVVDRGFECLQPSPSASWCTSDGTCDVDSYPPNLAPLVQVQTGPKGDKGDPGPQGPAGTTTHSVGAVFDGGGSALSGTVIRCALVSYSGTIQAATLVSDIPGSATVDVRTVAYSSYTGPSSATSITASAIPTLSSATKYQDTTLAGWSTSLSANTMVCFQLSSPSMLTWAAINLKVAAN